MSVRYMALALALLGLAAVAPLAHAQVNTTSSIPVRNEPTKSRWVTMEVVRADRNTLVVKEVGHEMFVHTFTYGPKAAEQMDRVIAAGGYQHGDVIKVRYESGKTIALEIKGKPSS